jgi:hypothetical protein
VEAGATAGTMNNQQEGANVGKSKLYNAFSCADNESTI